MSESQPNRPKSPWLAAALSALFPGLGQIFCRQDNKGVFLFGIFLLGHWSTGGITSCLLCPAAALDAFLLARKLNCGNTLRRWEFFPGSKALNNLPSHVIPVTLVSLVTFITLVRIVKFAYAD